MKHTSIFIAMSIMLFVSCRKEDLTHSDLTPVGKSSKQLPVFRYSGSDYSRHISKDTADRMVASYLQSIGTSGQNTSITSFTFTADSMRAYLSLTQIATLKFSVAHRRSYINAGNYGIHAAIKASALTFIVSGLDEEDDNYVLAGGNDVYDLATSERISMDTANRMIGSYLESINYTTNATDLQSMTFDADTMRHFLQNSDVVKLHFVIAHRDTYINAGFFGSYCGAAASGLTFIIFGLDNAGEIIYTSNGMVMEHTRPCPAYCTNSPMLTL